MSPRVIPTEVIDQVVTSDLTTALAARAELDVAIKTVAWASFSELVPQVVSVSVNDERTGWCMQLRTGRVLKVPSSCEPSAFRSSNDAFYGPDQVATDDRFLTNLRIALSVPTTGEHAMAAHSLRELLLRLHRHLAVIYPLHEAS